jgi:NADPH:quinone reductase-like Zn-dependent oxidoreductase
MQAMVYTQYGAPEVLHLQDIPKPTPADHEIRVKIYATSVTAGDWRMRKADPFAARLYNGLFRPLKVTILGFDLAGEVDAVGSDVTKFKPGDQVFAWTGFGFGAYAEYKCMPEDGVVAAKPANLSYEEAAGAASGAITALLFLQAGSIQPGQTVLVYGASGSVGTYAVQLARHFGATVTGVCSTGNVELVKSLGAEQVIDYKREDFTRTNQTYDVIYDTVGKTSFAACKHLLKPDGRYIAGSAGVYEHLQALWTSKFGDQKVISSIAAARQADIIFLKGLLEAGHIKPVIDKCYPFDQIPAAHHYVETGRKKGNVVVSVAQPKQA